MELSNQSPVKFGINVQVVFDKLLRGEGGQERQGEGTKESPSSDESDSGEPEWELWGRIPVIAMAPVVPQTDFRVQRHFSWKGGTYGFNESVLFFFTIPYVTNYYETSAH